MKSALLQKMLSEKYQHFPALPGRNCEVKKWKPCRISLHCHFSAKMKLNRTLGAVSISTGSGTSVSLV
jgi:hypothetical protein